MLALHNMQMSGNCYKVRLVSRQLQIPVRLIDYPVGAAKTRTSEFLAKNPNGRVPLLELEDGRCLAESNAIISWLARDSAFVPHDPWAHAKMLEWMFFEQYSHEPYIAFARFWLAWAPKQELERKRHLIAEWHEKGNAALQVMNSHLSQQDWFAGDSYSLADIALYAYTHAADEGGFELSRYPAVCGWLKRVAAQPKHVPLSESW
jgi:glutathione S-transferase